MWPESREESLQPTEGLDKHAFTNCGGERFDPMDFHKLEDFSKQLTGCWCHKEMMASVLPSTLKSLLLVGHAVFHDPYFYAENKHCKRFLCLSVGYKFF